MTETTTTPRTMYNPDDVLTMRQVADYLQVSIRTVQRIGIKSFRLGGRRFLFKHVLEYVESKAA